MLDIFFLITYTSFLHQQRHLCENKKGQQLCVCSCMYMCIFPLVAVFLLFRRSRVVRRYFAEIEEFFSNLELNDF